MLETYLEPASADSAVGLCVADFLHVRHDGPLMTRINDIIRPAGKSMAPIQLHSAASLERNHSIRLRRRVGAAIAHDIVGGYIVDWAIVAGYTHAGTDCAGIDGEEDCVRGGEGQESEESGFHDCDEGCDLGEWEGWWMRRFEKVLCFSYRKEK